MALQKPYLGIPGTTGGALIPRSLIRATTFARKSRSTSIRWLGSVSAAIRITWATFVSCVTPST